MPTRNRVKIYGEDQYYHVYNRGVNKNNIFREDTDYLFFLNLLKRHLSETADSTDSYGRPHANYQDEVELICYCLMPNHFHMLFYLKERDGLVHLMRSVMTAYSMYFNKKYDRTGGLFQGRFLAAIITTDLYLWHVSRYIHLNPLDIGKNFERYSYSSIGYFSGGKHATWIHPGRLVETPDESEKYMQFVADYKSMHAELDHIAHLLAAK